jgi:hypothetical protein
MIPKKVYNSKLSNLGLTTPTNAMKKVSDNNKIVDLTLKKDFQKFMSI